MNERHIFEIPKEVNNCLAVLVTEESDVDIVLRSICIKGELTDIERAGILFVTFLQISAIIKNTAKSGCKMSKLWCKQIRMNPFDPTLTEIAGSLLFFQKLNEENHD